MSVERRIAELDTDRVAGEIIDALQAHTRKEYLGRLNDRFKGPLDDLKDRISRRTWRLAQRHLSWDEDQMGPVLYPDGTRLFYTKGETTIVLFEQKPAVRSVVFHSSLLRLDEDQNHYFNLAFPYVVFVFHFRAGIFQNVYCTFQKKQLTSVHERPLVPILPNIERENLRVCIGNFQPESSAGDFNGQITEVVGNFWSSMFTSSWAENYYEYQQSEARFSTPRQWEASSRSNPVFPLEVNWRESSYPTYRHLFTRIWDNDAQLQSFDRDLFNDLVIETTQELQAILEGQAGATDAEVRNALRSKMVEVVSSIINP